MPGESSAGPPSVVRRCYLCQLLAWMQLAKVFICEVFILALRLGFDLPIRQTRHCKGDPEVVRVALLLYETWHAHFGRARHPVRVHVPPDRTRYPLATVKIVDEQAKLRIHRHPSVVPDVIPAILSLYDES